MTGAPDLIARVAMAIDACPNLWFRGKKGYYPWEVCRYGATAAEAKIVVVKQFATYEQAEAAHTTLMSEARARAAIDAIKEFLKAADVRKSLLSDGTEEPT